MVRIRVTYEPSGHADIRSAIPCAKVPPAPNLQEGLAQGSVALTLYPTICCVADPSPCATQGATPLVIPAGRDAIVLQE